MKLLIIPEIIGLEGVFTDGDWIESKDQDPKGSVRLIQLADIGVGQFLNKSNRRLTKEKAISLKCTFLRKGDILLARMPDPLGRCCLFPGLDEECVTVVDVCIIRTNDDVGYNKFLMHLINSQTVRSQIEKQATGTTRIRISRGNLSKIKLPIPEIVDQIRIAHLLSKVEGLIAQRKQHLQQLDDLLKSAFLKMFGDPVRNEKGWGRKIFSDFLINIDSGSSPKCEAREATENEWGVLKLGAVTSCFYRENENKALPYNVVPQCKHEVKVGDLLFSRKNTYDLVAACAYVFKTRPKMLMPDLIFRFVFKDEAEINPIYIWKLLISESQRRRIQSLAAGAAGSMPNISKANLKRASLPIPPLLLQNQFAAIVEKVEGIKSQYQQSLTELENLYGVLSQRAFKGELDLSRVPLPASLVEGEQALTIAPLPTQAAAPTKLLSQTVNESLVLCAELTPFNTETFEKYLVKRAGEVITATTLWQVVQDAQFDNLPPTFESFKRLLSNYLERGVWLEQVYGELTQTSSDEESGARIAFRVRDDS